MGDLLALFSPCWAEDHLGCFYYTSPRVLQKGRVVGGSWDWVVFLTLRFHFFWECPRDGTRPGYSSFQCEDCPEGGGMKSERQHWLAVGRALFNERWCNTTKSWILNLCSCSEESFTICYLLQGCFGSANCPGFFPHPFPEVKRQVKCSGFSSAYLCVTLCI